MIDLSIVFGTYNRLFYLRILEQSTAIADLYKSKLDVEYIIVDGGSTDGTVSYLRDLKDVILIDQGGLLGCVDAYNKGFARARGKYVAFLNDDVTVENDALAQSVEMLDNNPNIGMVAIPYENPGMPRMVAYCTAGSPSKKYLFACFGVLRRELGERAGWFDGFYHYCGDSHLAMSIWKMGYRVEELKTGGYIKHYDAPSPVKDKDPSIRGKIKNDWRLWGEKWGSWNHEIDSRNEKDMVEANMHAAQEMPEE
ncbi:MAG: glycosyltransferase [Candidatus Paceibacterota bacterium]|jgi:GT2 family glycosyltransferase